MLQEELDLKPGQSFLDVGCGCGIVTACAAYLVSTPPTPPGVLYSPSGFAVRCSRKSSAYMYRSGESSHVGESAADEALTIVEGAAYHACRWGAVAALSHWSVQGLELVELDFTPSCK